MTMEIKKEITSYIMSIVAWTLFLVLATCFWFIPKNQMLASVKAESMAYSQGNDSFYLEELNDGFKLENVFPTSDEYGKTQKPFMFQIVNNLGKEVDYKIIFTNQVNSLPHPEKALNNNNLRYQLICNKVEGPVQNLATSGLILIQNIKANSKDIYELRVWLDQEAGNEAQDKEFKGYIAIDTVSK
ncbi:MAG: hypothetical protein RR047_03315 [Bacilli bacterium]